MGAGCCSDGREDSGSPSTAADDGQNAPDDCGTQAEWPPCAHGDGCCVDAECDGDSVSSVHDLKLECCDSQEERCDGTSPCELSALLVGAYGVMLTFVFAEKCIVTAAAVECEKSCDDDPAHDGTCVKVP